MTDDPVTNLLADPSLSDDDRAARLLPLVYEQLRAVANARMGGERRDHTLQATALVHEAYLRLVGERQIPWQNRAHFYAAAAEAMQRILLDHAKGKGRQKRGGNRRHEPLHANVCDLAAADDPEAIVSLDRAVRRLESEDSGIGAVVRLRFYAGLTIEQTGEALGISPATVKRRWEFGRTWLFRELREADHGTDATD